MKVSAPLSQFNLAPGEYITIKLDHWIEPKKAEVLEINKPAYCQMHGERMEDEVLFRKIKASGEISVMFALPLSHPAQIIKHGRQRND